MTDTFSNLLHAHDYAADTGARGDTDADLRLASRLLEPAATTTVPLLPPLLMPLLDQGIIRASGPDAADFLQNLLTNDVKTLASDEARLAGFCTPKGRLLALFHLWRDANQEGDLLLMLPREILPAMLKKLSTYVLRSKVKLTDASADVALWGWAFLGANPADAPAAVGVGAAAAAPHSGDFISPAPKGIPFGPPTFVGMHTVRLNRTAHPALGLLVAPMSTVAEWGEPLLAGGKPVGLPVWHWLEIVAGVPRIVAATQEAFVPQMLNMELRAVSGISFSKGCYPGQEIVARTQYLGKIKRRMYRARLGISVPAGTSVFAPDTGDQPCGSLVSVATAPDGQIEALVCVQSGAVDAGTVHVGALTGPALSILGLPYALDGPDTRNH